jgi:hypothetical protein
MADLCEIRGGWRGPVRVVTICRESASTPANLRLSNDEHWNPPFYIVVSQCLLALEPTMLFGSCAPKRSSSLCNSNR